MIGFFDPRISIDNLFILESWSYALLVAGLAFAGIFVIYNDGSKLKKMNSLPTLHF